MKNLNKKIKLYIPTEGVNIYRYAFSNKSDEKGIAALKKLYYKDFALKHERARIYCNDKIVFEAFQGVDVTDKPNEDYYGYEISKYKLKIKTAEGNLPPFYSNVLLEKESDEKAYYDLINRFVKTKYRKAFKHGLIYDISGTEEVLVFNIRKDFKTRNIYIDRE